MKADLFLGVDIGTSGMKTALIDENGRAQFTQTESYPVERPGEGLAEQDPELWWDALLACLRRTFEQGADPSRIAGIGIDGHSWSAIAVDRDGRVLAKSPIWMDTRAQGTCEIWAERLGSDRIFEVSGNPFSPTYTLPKVLHWMEHEPELISKTDAFLQTNGFLAYRLTGVKTLDFSQAYSWHNFDIKALRYDEALSKAFGLPERFLIPPQASDSIAGTVTAAAAAATGLLEGTPVVAGGLDAACATLGVGVIDAGQTQEQGGQAGGMSICLNRALADPRLILGAHVVPGRWLLQGGSVGGGASLKWFAREFGALDKHGAPIGNDDMLFSRLSDEAAQAPPGSHGVIFLPYLSGERSPVWDAHARGMYFGLQYATSRADLARATMEGVAYSLKHNLETAADAGASVSELRGTGGSANSLVWTQIKADVTGLPMVIPASDTATTCGAAMLAMLALGLYPDYRAAADAIVDIKRVQAPKPENTVLYAEYYGVYKTLYGNNCSAMRRLGEIGARSRKDA